MKNGILIIHEDAFQRDMIALCLTHHGYVCIAGVHNLDKGLELLPGTKPAIVILSGGVLEMSDLNAGQKIREAGGSAVKIVVLGDDCNQDLRERVKQINADSFADQSPGAFFRCANLLKIGRAHV